MENELEFMYIIIHEHYSPCSYTLHVRYFIFFIKSSKGKAKMSGETKDYGISSQWSVWEF